MSSARRRSTATPAWAAPAAPVAPVTATEVSFLHSLPDRNLFGDPMCEAFGYWNPSRLLEGEPLRKDWVFSIEYNKGAQQLQACIDTYQPPIDGEFDSEAWLHLECLASRKGWIEMTSIVRGLVSGRTVELPDGVKLNLESWREQG